MPVKAAWYIPDQVFYLELTGNITVHDLEILAQISAYLIETYRGVMIHNVTDTSHIEKLSISLPDVIRTFKVFSKSQLSGWVIFVGDVNKILHFIMSTLSQLLGYKFRVFKTLEEGLTFLNNADRSLPALLPERELTVDEKLQNLMTSIES